MTVSTREIKEILKDVGLEMESIWCGKTDELDGENSDRIGWCVKAKDFIDRVARGVR